MSDPDRPKRRIDEEAGNRKGKLMKTTKNFTTTILVDRTPQQAFDAINDVRGWWSGEIEGPTDVLGALRTLERALADYHLFYAARADMLERTGNDPRLDLEKALSLVTNEGERRLLERRLRDCPPRG
jgi:hypothetical protein